MVCVAGGAGCYESLTCIATPAKLVFYDELLGDFNAVEPASGRITLQKAAGNAYSYLHYDDKGVQQNKGALRVIKFGDDHDYELTGRGLCHGRRQADLLHWTPGHRRRSEVKDVDGVCVQFEGHAV